MRALRTRGDTGAITIHVALALMGMLAFLSFVIDYGVMWVARAEAQNAADAAALAGMRALVQRGVTGSAARGAARTAARDVAAENPVWGQANTSENVDLSFVGPAVIDACSVRRSCMRVDVLRGAPDRAGATRGDPLPVFFAPLVGIGSQGVRATATARAIPATPAAQAMTWAVTDRWAGMATQLDLYPGTGYIAPTSDDPGTGFTLADLGRQIVLWQTVRRPYLIPSADNHQPVIRRVTSSSGIGNAPSVTRTIIGRDPTATADADTGQVQGSVRVNSPRVVPVAVLRPDSNATPATAEVVNVAALFVEGTCADAVLDAVTQPVCAGLPARGIDQSFAVVGRLVSAPGRAPEPALTISSAFYNSVQLVR